MALDIEIEDLPHLKKIQLGVSDFNVIVNKLETLNNCPILERSFMDYFSDNEIYLNELNLLREEIFTISNSLMDADETSTLLFLNEFLNLTETAIKKRKTIKFIAD